MGGKERGSTGLIPDDKLGGKDTLKIVPTTRKISVMYDKEEEYQWTNLLRKREGGSIWH